MGKNCIVKRKNTEEKITIKSYFKNFNTIVILYIFFDAFI